MRTRWAAVLFLLISSSCVQRMGTEGHVLPLERFSRRPLPDGVVAQSGGEIPAQPALTRHLLESGRTNYNVFCLPCHGVSGHGDGMVVQRGFLAPPSYHTDRLRNAPDAHFYDVITRGTGAMYSYADRVPPEDRWAIVAYIRALQLSQNAPWSRLGERDRQALEEVQ